MTKEEFFKLLCEEVQGYKEFLETDNNEWIVKGFIDVDKNVYTITNDTKVVSKIIACLIHRNSCCDFLLVGKLPITAALILKKEA